MLALPGSLAKLPGCSTYAMHCKPDRLLSKLWVAYLRVRLQRVFALLAPHAALLVATKRHTCGQSNIGIRL
jgi:hypothetical protein